MIRTLVLTVGVLVALHAGVAEAVCRVTCGCGTPSGWVVVGLAAPQTNPDGGEGQIALRVQQVFGQPDASVPAIGSLISTSQFPGQHIIGQNTDWAELVTDGGVVCGTVRVPVEEYAAMQLQGSCAALDERRFVQPPCNDNGGGCRCSSVSGPFIGLAMTLAVALRRRASRR
ncbi:MAG: hypothetical protein Q8L14_33290 [Myxococcales bacterium]|nr:hypothetical protein [Myxococcales bacterium]